MNAFTRNTVALVAVSALHLAFFAGIAHASEVPAVHVSYADLNLESASGAKALYQRIQIASAQVCGDVDSRQPDVAAAAKDCANRAIVDGIGAVKSERLNQVARNHGYHVR